MEYVISNSNFVEEAYSTGLAGVDQELLELLRVLRHLLPPWPPKVGGNGGREMAKHPHEFEQLLVHTGQPCGIGLLYKV